MQSMCHFSYSVTVVASTRRQVRARVPFQRHTQAKRQRYQNTTAVTHSHSTCRWLKVSAPFLTALRPGNVELEVGYPDRRREGGRSIARGLTFATLKEQTFSFAWKTSKRSQPSICAAASKIVPQQERSNATDVKTPSRDLTPHTYIKAKNYRLPSRSAALRLQDIARGLTPQSLRAKGNIVSNRPHILLSAEKLKISKHKQTRTQTHTRTYTHINMNEG